MKKIIPFALLIMTMLVFFQCSSGDDGTDGDDECPAGQEIGPDGKCHTVVDGDEKPDGDKTDADTDSVVDGDTDKITDGDLDTTDGDVDDDKPVDGDSEEFDFEDKPDGDLDPDPEKELDEEIIETDTVELDETQAEVEVEFDLEPEVEIEYDPEIGLCQDGAYCDIDDHCGFGCHCAGSGNECVQQCWEGGEHLCTSEDAQCCDYRYGKCIPCPVDGDEEEDGGGIIVCGNDDDCPQYMRCNPSGLCEQGDCTSDTQCDTNYYCTEHGRCLPVPEYDDEDEQLKRVYTSHCDVNEDCKDGYYCHWDTNLCVPGCRSDADCFIDAPTCKKGICY